MSSPAFTGIKRLWADNALSIVVLILFFVFWLAQGLAGWATFNEDQLTHHEATVTFARYLGSSHFWSATAENWESEFLQMGVYVALTVYLKQRGSAESNPYPDEESVGEADAPSDPSEAPGPVKRGGWVLALYRNSLTLVFVAFFLASIILHAINAHHVYNQEQLAHGEKAVTLLAFLGHPDFWFQSFQNWQSEFLAIGSLVLFTIFLRQVGSSQSKAVEAPHSKTGD